jgi:hypothetical protein
LFFVSREQIRLVESGAHQYVLSLLLQTKGMFTRQPRAQALWCCVTRAREDTRGGGGGYVRLAISQSPGYSRANPMLEGQEIWQHTFN